MNTLKKQENTIERKKSRNRNYIQENIELKNEALETLYSQNFVLLKLNWNYKLK